MLDVTGCHLGDETIAVNAMMMNKLGKSGKPRLGGDKILGRKKIVIRLSFFTDTTLEEIVSCEKFHVS